MQRKFKIVGSLLTLSIIYLIVALLFSYDPTQNLWAQVQSVVGITTWGNNGDSTASITFRRWRSNIDDVNDDPVETVQTQGASWPEVQTMGLLWGGSGENAWHRQFNLPPLVGSTGINTTAYGILMQDSDSLYQILQSVGSIEAVPAQTPLNVPAVGPVLVTGTEATPASMSGVPQRGVSGENLSVVTSVGIPMSAPYATWTITNAPAAATQATASKAAGGGTVRHVVTSWQACLYTATAATVPVAQAAVTRDGATGAGTIKENFAVGSGIVQGAQCVNSAPGMTWIGTANTALTIEFAAAPPANVLQTVSLTGYSVP